MCDFYNGVSCQRVIVKKKKKIYKASFFTTKTPCISPLHLRDTLHRNSKICTFSIVPSCWIWYGNPAFCLVMSLFVFRPFLFFSIQVKSCDRRDERLFFFGWKEGWNAERSRCLSLLSLKERLSARGRALSHRPRLRGTANWEAWEWRAWDFCRICGPNRGLT